MSRFFEMFRQSPFDPLQEHMDQVISCVRLVKPMFEALRDGQRDTLESLTKKIFKSEHEADLIKDEIRQTIPHTFYLPVYRGDLLGYLKLQDDMADSAEDLAVLLTIKPLAMPLAIAGESMAYVDGVMKVVDLVRELSSELKLAVERGFHPKLVESVLTHVQGVERAEFEADRMQYKLSQSLFALEGGVSAVDIMLWFKIFGELGQMANHAESLADRVRRMITAR